MRILTFGRGVIATIYGQALDAAGHDVEFYVRPGRAAEYGDTVEMDVIDARSRPLGRRMRHTYDTRLRESLNKHDGFDLIVLSVGHHHLADAAKFLASRLGSATVLVLGNVWGELTAAVAPLPADRVVFGFPQAGGGFGDDGVLRGALMSSIVIGTAGEVSTTRQQQIFAAFRDARLALRRHSDIQGWLWLHFLADAAMFDQALRSGSLAAMIGDRRAFRDAFLTARELLPLLGALGVDPRRHRIATMPFRFPRATAALVAWATRAMPIAQRSLAAHTDPRTTEALAVLDDAMREARRLGLSTPRLDRPRERAPLT